MGIPEAKIYEPDNCLKQGYIGMLPAVFSELYANRWLTYQLFKRDLTAGYRQSFGGFFYLLLVPLLGVATFAILNNAGVFKIGEINVPYPIFAVMGTAFWQLFAAAVTSGAGSLIAAGPMISKINFSKKSLVLASTAQSITFFLVQFVLLMILFLVYGRPPTVWIVIMPFFAVPVLLLGVGLGFLLALLNAIVRDVGSLLASFLNLLMFLTPVLYVKPHIGILSKATMFNPVYYLVSSPRDMVLRGILSHPEGYFISVALAVAVFLVCLIAFHVTESRVAERI